MIARESGFCYALALAAAGVLVSGLAAVSHAAPSPRFYVSLRYEAGESPERCGDEAQFRRQVATAVGYDPFRADAAVRVVVHVGGTADLVDGRVEWQSAEGAAMGERRFRAKDGDCTKLLTEISFAVGLQIELLRPKSSAEAVDPASGEPTAAAAAPSAAVTPPDAKPAPPAAPPAPTNAPEASSTSQERASRANPSARAWRFHAGVGPSLAFGSAPALTGHGRIFAGAEHGEVALELGFEGTLAVTEREPDGSGFSQNILGGSATACRLFEVAFGCAIAKAGRLSVDGLGVDQPRSPAAFVAQAGIRVGARVNLSDTWFIAPHADALGLLTPRSIQLNQTEVWDLPTLSALVGIDAGGRFR